MKRLAHAKRCSFKLRCLPFLEPSHPLTFAIKDMKVTPTQSASLENRERHEVRIRWIERRYATRCPRSPTGRLVGRHCQRSGRSKTRCIGASMRDPPTSNFVSQQRVRSDQKLWGGPRQGSRSYASALRAKIRHVSRRGRGNPHSPQIPIDHFLNLATAESSLGARVVVRETLHFKLERRSTLQNAVTSLLKRRSQPAV